MSRDSQYQIEQNKVLQNFLDVLLTYWNEDSYNKRGENCEDNSFFLEVYVTGSCNQKCSYCYLTRHGDKLYPYELRDEKKILNNLNILYSFLSEKNVHLGRMDFFSGEIWGTSFGNKVFDLTLYYLTNSNLKIDCIIIPTNFSFCQDKEKIKVIDEYIRKFRVAGSDICLSCSMDGLVMDNLNRPLNSDKKKTNEFYSNVFAFCKKHDFGYHPMIAPENIEKQSDNYDSWLNAFSQVYGPNPKDSYGFIMQLEVRNGEWDENRIFEYCKWLNHVIETDKKVYFDNDDKLFQQYLVGNKKDFGKFERSYNPYRLTQNKGVLAGLPSCTLGQMLCVRAGDLAICPCHRTSYEKFLFGHFTVEDNKITGVEAGNIPLMNSVYRTHHGVKPKCDQCWFEKYCLRGCLGAQYEFTGDIHYPIENVCEMQMGKITFLFEKYKALGYLDGEKYPEFKEIINSLLTDYRELIQTEDYKKWLPIIQPLL